MHSGTPVRDSESKFAKFFADAKVSAPFDTSTVSYATGKLTIMHTPAREESVPTFERSCAYLTMTASIRACVPISFFASFDRTEPSAPAPSGPPNLIHNFRVPTQGDLEPLSTGYLTILVAYSSISTLRKPTVAVKHLSSAPNGIVNSGSDSVFFVYLVVFFGCTFSSL